jgi:hypothetical protein
METFTNLTAKQLRQAADLKERIDALQETFSQLVGAPAPAPAPASVVVTEKRKRKKISAAGIARIRAAQKARWAAIKQDNAAPTPKKRKVSAAGRAKLAALARARWAKIKAAGKSSL